MTRVDRQIGGAGLQDGDEGDDQLCGAGQGEGHDLLGPGALGDEPVREPVGARVQLRVREPLFAEDDGRGVRGARHLLLEEVDRRERRDGPCGVVPLLQEEPPLLGAEQVEAADRQVRVVGGRVQEPGETGRDGVHAPGVEQVGAVLEEPGQTRGAAVLGEAFLDVEEEVEAGRARVQEVGGDLQAGDVEARRRGVLHHQGHLEQRVPADGARRVEVVDQVLEGHVLVLVRAQGHVPDAVEQVTEGGVARGVVADDEGVDEEADGAVEALVGAARDR